jgi:hypothetical protein
MDGQFRTRSIENSAIGISVVKVSVSIEHVLDSQPMAVNLGEDPTRMAARVDDSAGSGLLTANHIAIGLDHADGQSYDKQE